MSAHKEQLILATDDHAIIMQYIKRGLSQPAFTRKEAAALEAELKKAILVDKALLPADVVCLNSTVMIKDEKANKVMELTLVIPEKADIKQRKVSIFSPIAAALIGFRKGMRVVWEVPAGFKTFCILDVRNPMRQAT